MKHKLLLSILLLLLPQVHAYSEEARFFFSSIRQDANNESIFVQESFVYGTEDADEISFMRKILNKEISGAWLWEFEISLDPVPYNRNYHAAGQPVWNWSFSKAGAIDKTFIRIDPTHPSIVASLKLFNEDPAGWISLNGTSANLLWARLDREVTGLEFSPLINLSSRSEITEINGIAIAGFFIPEGLPKTLLIRGMGPALSGAVEKNLEDPKLILFDHTPAKIAENDDWRVGQSLENFEGLPEFLLPSQDKEAALVVTLWPGLYTAHLISGTVGDFGTGLVEIYDITGLD